MLSFDAERPMTLLVGDSTGGATVWKCNVDLTSPPVLQGVGAPKSQVLLYMGHTLYT